MKLVVNKEGLRFAVPTTKKEKIALQKLKYDLFDDYENSLDWNVGNLSDEQTAMRYMFWMYQGWYFNTKEAVNVSMDWRCWGDNDTIDVSYYRPVFEGEECNKVINGKEYKYCCDTIGIWIPSNYMTLVAYYRMKGKFRKVAMLLKKYGKDSTEPGLHL